MTNIVNLTPHELNLRDEEGNNEMRIPASGQIARVEMTRERIGEHNGIPLFKIKPGKVTGLPEPIAGVLFVVSGVVRSAVDRPDLWQPGELVRDTEGRVIGAVGLSQ